MLRTDTPLTHKLKFQKKNIIPDKNKSNPNQETYTVKERAIERWETDGGSVKNKPLGKNKKKS